METISVSIPVDAITDWPTFHDVFQRALGFPDFYGRNMDAWIDCMTSVDAQGDGLTKVTVRPGGLLVMKLDNAINFRKRCPEQFNALIECCAFVNFRRAAVGEAPVLALLLAGSA